MVSDITVTDLSGKCPRPCFFRLEDMARREPRAKPKIHILRNQNRGRLKHKLEDNMVSTILDVRDEGLELDGELMDAFEYYIFRKYGCVDNVMREKDIIKDMQMDEKEVREELEDYARTRIPYLVEDVEGNDIVLVPERLRMPKSVPIPIDIEEEITVGLKPDYFRINTEDGTVIIEELKSNIDNRFVEDYVMQVALYDRLGKLYDQVRERTYLSEARRLSKVEGLVFANEHKIKTPTGMERIVTADEIKKYGDLGMDRIIKVVYPVMRGDIDPVIDLKRPPASYCNSKFCKYRFRDIEDKPCMWVGGGDNTDWKGTV